MHATMHNMLCSFQHSEAFFTVSHWQEVRRQQTRLSEFSFPTLSRLLNEIFLGGDSTDPNMDFLNRVTCPSSACQQQPMW